MIYHHLGSTVYCGGDSASALVAIAPSLSGGFAIMARKLSKIRNWTQVESASSREAANKDAEYFCEMDPTDFHEIIDEHAEHLWQEEAPAEGWDKAYHGPIHVGQKTYQEVHNGKPYDRHTNEFWAYQHVVAVWYGFGRSDFAIFARRDRGYPWVHVGIVGANDEGDRDWPTMYSILDKYDQDDAFRFDKCENPPGDGILPPTSRYCASDNWIPYHPWG